MGYGRSLFFVAIFALMMPVIFQMTDLYTAHALNYEETVNLHNECRSDAFNRKFKALCSEAIYKTAGWFWYYLAKDAVINVWYQTQQMMTFSAVIKGMMSASIPMILTNPVPIYRHIKSNVRRMMLMDN